MIMNRQATTDLDLVKDRLTFLHYKPEEIFLWGKIIQIHILGKYELIECHPWISRSKYDKEKVNFHGYIDGKDVSMYWNSLEEAIVGLIAYNRDGSNSQAAHFFMKMTEPHKK